MMNQVLNDLCDMANNNRLEDIGWTNLFYIDFRHISSMTIREMDGMFMKDGLKINAVIVCQTNAGLHFYLYGDDFYIQKIMDVSRGYGKLQNQPEKAIIKFEDTPVYIYFPPTNAEY